jgi:hypothetical protein
MDLKKLENKTIATIDGWIKELDRFSMEQLLQSPGEGQWCLGQVYIHLWMASKGFFYKNAAKCLDKVDTQQGGSKTFSGVIVFILGIMPPVKVKMPGKVAVQPNLPESKEQIIKKLEEIKQMTRDYIARLPQSDPNLKTKHPFLGWLNCAEWVRLNEMHFKHHLRQKARIEQHFGWR